MYSILPLKPTEAPFCEKRFDQIYDEYINHLDVMLTNTDTKEKIENAFEDYLRSMDYVVYFLSNSSSFNKERERPKYMITKEILYKK
jgi:hypothetical protein